MYVIMAAICQFLDQKWLNVSVAFPVPSPCPAIPSQCIFPKHCSLFSVSLFQYVKISFTKIFSGFIRFPKGLICLLGKFFAFHTPIISSSLISLLHLLTGVRLRGDPGVLSPLLSRTSPKSYSSQEMCNFSLQLVLLALYYPAIYHIYSLARNWLPKMLMGLVRIK